LFLFIFENFGTQELLLVGVIALILLGPRRMPEMARKIGKMMSEFRGTANEFKDTWQREVNFEEEAKALDLNTLEAETVEHVGATDAAKTTDSPVEPMVKQIDPARFENLDLAKTAREQTPNTETESQPTLPLETVDPNDKKNWL